MRLSAPPSPLPSRQPTRKGFETDAFKYFLAQELGWTVWRLPSSLIQSRFVVALIARCEGREVEVPKC